MKQRFIDVVLNVPLDQTFIYREPECSENETPPEDVFGRRVEVRFGNRKLTGFAVRSYDEYPQECGVPLEKIRSAVKWTDEEPLLTQELYSIAQWMRKYYICTIGECVSVMVPSGKRESSEAGFAFSDDESSFEKKELSEEQKEAVRGITGDNPKLFHYLYGMTGSGKTEVFLTAAEKKLQEGKGVIYLVPEIGLTPQVVRAVTKRFGNTAAVLHSSLTPSQRLAQWNRILKKEARVVIGARTAVFAPVPDLGMIIIDEEHDSSYKSGSSPRYHARQVAMFRSLKNKIPLVMGSATPSVESWHSMQQGTIIKHTLTRRLAGGSLPTIKTVNLSLQKQSQNCISGELEQEIRETLKEKKQVILFLNRRGFTHFFRCSSCGYEIKCRQCSVSLTYHKSENRLRCHYCGYSIQPPQQCPKCGSLDVGYFGFGTEYIENTVRVKFPNARIIRVDTDSLKKKGELEEKIDAFRKGEYDILLGTQMVAKGLNFPNLKTVGVVLADTSLHLPDFRAGEKTFALLTQVAGRAGRFSPDGRVIIQSYSPDREAVKLAAENDIETFYRNELAERQMLSFPPFSRLLRLVFRSQIKEEAENTCRQAAVILNEMTDENTPADILGPAECPLVMVSGNYRWQLLLRSRKAEVLQKLASALIRQYAPPRNVYIEIDMDPVSMM
ncbi:primosomal protein N' [Treponema sp.]|uniref:replication restart helicase PriA n=1 Tax=Treponema sp. TaxID=166 RepID=UPI00257E779C|nr:primosomal protein N' [Treponema sp.]MBE6354413.1 primosomal protein N' [Treponema sp.]